MVLGTTGEMNTILNPLYEAADMDRQELQNLMDRMAHMPSNDDAMNLLSAFFAGYPIATLRQFLSSDNPATVKAAVWIASELAERAAPLLDEIGSLLTHPLAYVRFFAIDCVLACATGDDGAVLARTVGLLHDPDSGVRWKVMHFLAKASIEQLRASIDFLDDTHLCENVSWLLSHPRVPPVPDALLAKLTSSDSDDRMFAVGAAARGERVDLAALRAAASMDDKEIAAFAREVLTAHQMTPPGNNAG